MIVLQTLIGLVALYSIYCIGLMTTTGSIKAGQETGFIKFSINFGYVIAFY